MRSRFFAAWTLLSVFLSTVPGPISAWAEEGSESIAVMASPTSQPGEESPAATGEILASAEEDADDTITMSFDGASLKDVLLLFSQKTGMNFVASQDIEARKITVYFEGVSPKEALDAIMTTNNLTYTRKSGSSIYMVYTRRTETAEVVTKVFRLKYARLSTSPLDIGGQQTVKDLKTMASAGSSSSGGGGGGESASSGGSGGSAGSASSGSSARGIDMVLRSFLSSQGRLAVDNATNSIIITDTQESLNQIQKMLLELDVPQQQVILEVHIMEVQKGLVSDQGVEWGGANGALFEFQGGNRTTSFPLMEKLFTTEGIPKPRVVEGSGNSDVRTAGDTLLPQMTFGTLSANDFSAVLHMISTDQKTKILARPRILTQNNEAAVIRLVQNTAIANQTETTTSEGVASSSTNEAERSETGVTLRMTPQINSDMSVTMFLEPSVTTVGISVFFPDDFLDPTTRVVRTMARVHDNETLVIGGLIDSTSTLSKRKVPYLGDIPGIGRLFSYEEVDNSDRELVVFITPHLVTGRNSLTQNGVTALGKDVAAKHLLDEFSELEADVHLSAFEPTRKNLDTIGNARARRERNAAIEAGLKAGDPAVERQMAMALDAFSPQLLDDEISKALSFQSTSSSRSKNG